MVVGIEVEKPGEHAREEEILQHLQSEGVELNPTAEAPEDVEAETNPTEQEVERDPAMELGTSPAAAEVGVNTAEGVEIFPAEGVETNFAKTRREKVVVVTDDEGDVEKEPPRETTGQEVGGHEESPARSVAGATRRRMRHLIDEATEEEEDDTIFQPIGGQRSQHRPVSEENLLYRVRQFGLPTEETAESERRRERKRKGKEIANPARKKGRQPSMAVVIQERTLDQERQAREEESEENEVLRWERRSKRRHDETPGRLEHRPERARPQIRKSLIRLDRRLLDQMVRFNDPKQEEECEKRFGVNKKAKSGKKLHQPSLQKLGGEEKFLEYITRIGFEWLLEIDMSAAVALDQEFFTSF